MIYYLLFAMVMLVFDQISKWFVTIYLKLGETIPLWPNVFHITSVRNRGASFNIFEGQKWFLIVLALIISAVIVVYMRKQTSNKLTGIGLALVLSGTLGNMVDRIFRSEVIDMLDFRLINFPVFNGADIFITIGVFLFILSNLKEVRIS
ncbi:signal peptidase II [Paenibacillus sp. MMO-58]|uniref:signal peptidase II n=1 Tax=Paenibacillus sp. MMO-58 TaxID=3081290 RepID=UPI00301A13D4